MKPLRPLAFPPSPGWLLLVGLLIFATNLSAQENWQVEGTPPTLWSVTLWTFDTTTETWTQQTDASVKAGKGHPNTNQANIMVGDWHWFLSHNVHYLGRVHVETGDVEYLELPAQLMPSSESRELDLRLWGTGNPNNRPLDAAGLAVGDKGHSGTGWGHISAASPIRVGRYLFLPVITGTVYVIDTEIESLAPNAIVSINDLGTGNTITDNNCPPKPSCS